MHLDQEFRFQDEFALLVLLRRLISLVVLPPDQGRTLATVDVPYHVSPGGHRPLGGIVLRDVDDVFKEIRFPMLSAEILIAISMGQYAEPRIWIRKDTHTRLTMSSCAAK